MKTIKILLVFSISFFLVPHCDGQKDFQKGYIINLSSDTIRGVIDNKNWDVNPKQISFKSDNGNIAKFTTSDIKEFGVTGIPTEVYRRKILDLDKGPFDIKDLYTYPMPSIYRDTVFASLYESGTVNLYFLRDETLRYHFIIEKNDTGARDLRIERYIDGNSTRSNDIYKNQINTLMSDCGGIIMKISDLPFKENEIRRLVRYYNSCVGKATPKDPSYTQKKEKVQVLMGLMAYIGFRRDKFVQTLGMHPLVGVPLGPSLNTGAGIWASCILPRTNKKLEICGEAEWNYFDQTEHFTYSGGSALQTVHIAAHILKGNILLRYSIPVHKIKFTFSLGGSFGTALANTNIYIDDSGNTQEAIPFVKFQSGLIGGTGISVKEWGIELRYFYNSSISVRTIVRSYPHCLNLTLRYGFSLIRNPK